MPASLHPRRHAIAALHAQIARAEVIRSRYVRDLKALPGARRTRVLLRIAEERVDRLRRSRETLLSRQSGEEEPGIQNHGRWLA